MVEYMFDPRGPSGYEATWGTDPFARVHQVRWHPSDRPNEGAVRLSDSAALRLAGERTVPVTHRNRGSAHGADESSAQCDRYNPSEEKTVPMTHRNRLQNRPGV